MRKPPPGRAAATVGSMLKCDTCASRWDEGPAAFATLPGGECPLCGGELRDAGAVAREGAEPVRGEAARALRGRLLGVGA
jgi:hypothetical protein